MLSEETKVHWSCMVVVDDTNMIMFADIVAQFHYHYSYHCDMTGSAPCTGCEPNYTTLKSMVKY